MSQTSRDPGDQPWDRDVQAIARDEGGLVLWGPGPFAVDPDFDRKLVENRADADRKGLALIVATREYFKYPNYTPKGGRRPLPPAEHHRVAVSTFGWGNEHYGGATLTRPDGTSVVYRSGEPERTVDNHLTLRWPGGDEVVVERTNHGYRFRDLDESDRRQLLGSDIDRVSVATTSDGRLLAHNQFTLEDPIRLLDNIGVLVPAARRPISEVLAPSLEPTEVLRILTESGLLHAGPITINGQVWPQPGRGR